MVLIVSEEFDPSTDDVIRWLRKYGHPVTRFNSFEDIRTKEICLSSVDGFKSGNWLGIRNNDVKSIWFRRRPDFSNIEKQIKHNRNDSFTNETNRTLIGEESTAYAFMEEFFSEAKKIGSTKNSSINKLLQLKVAQKWGIRIPDTVILTDKDDLVRFREQHVDIILKPLSNMAMLRDEAKMYFTYTKIVSNELMKRIPQKFPPALFQEHIEKEFEIRSFFLNETEEYSMAIFSQKNYKTKVDFRKYDKEYPNRRVPFKLPKDINIKILNILRELDINTGSFDLIYTKTGEYVFLEVNPVGQFGMVSIPCNYYVEKRIAKLLSI